MQIEWDEAPAPANIEWNEAPKGALSQANVEWDEPKAERSMQTFMQAAVEAMRKGPIGAVMELPAAIAVHTAPTRPLDQASLGLARAANTVETLYRDHPDNLAGQDDPQNQQRLAQLKGERQISAGLLKEIQAEDNPAQRFTGDVVQSVGPSAVGLAAAALPGVSVPAAMAAGLGSNMLVETAGEFAERRDQYGQAQGDALAGAARFGAVSTALEAAPMLALTKYIKGPMSDSFGKLMTKVGAGEFVQEGGTQFFGDVQRNVENLESFGGSELAQRAGHAGLQGMAMAPLMGGAARLVQAGRIYGEQKKLEEETKKLFEVADKAEGEIRSLLERDVLGVDTAVAPATPLTGEERALAAIEAKQLKDGLDVAPTPEGVSFGQRLNARLMPKIQEGILAAPDAGGITEAVQGRRLREWESPELPPSQWPITAARGNEHVLGLTPEQVGELPQGAVFGIGDAGHAKFTADTKQRIVDTAAAIMDKYFPNQAILINFEGLNPNLHEDEFSLYQLGPSGETLTHIITPREMVNQVRHGKSDPKTSLAFTNSLIHELGHAVKIGTLVEGMQKQRVSGALLSQVLGEVQAV